MAQSLLSAMGDYFEVTTFRSDLTTDGRHSQVEFSTNIEDDAKRRDFTMNAIYMTIDGEIIDPNLGVGRFSKWSCTLYRKLLRKEFVRTTYGFYGISGFSLFMKLTKIE